MRTGCKFQCFRDKALETYYTRKVPSVLTREMGYNVVKGDQRGLASGRASGTKNGRIQHKQPNGYGVPGRRRAGAPLAAARSGHPSGDLRRLPQEASRLRLKKLVKKDKEEKKLRVGTWNMGSMMGRVK